MKFIITMNMPVRLKDRNAQQQFVHQIIAEHPAKTIEDIEHVLNQQDFIIVEEFYRDETGSFFSVGKTILNQRHIGKVKLANQQGG